MRDSRIDKHSRIAIIGAGPAGLSTAWWLRAQGYDRVTVLEKLGRVGGLCKSVTIDGMSYDLGANYLTWAYTETLSIAREVGATTYKEKPYTSIEILKDGDVETARYRSLTEAVLFNPFTKKKVSFFDLMVAALKYLWLRFRLARVIDRPDYLAQIHDDSHPELCVSFKHWLRTNGLDALASLFEFPVTIMGYGQLRHRGALSQSGSESLRLPWSFTKLYSWVTTHNYPTEVPVRFTSVLKKLVGVTQLYEGEFLRPHDFTHRMEELTAFLARQTRLDPHSAWMNSPIASGIAT